MKTLKLITDMLTAMRTDGISDDLTVRAAFFDKKAATWDAIATDDNPFNPPHARAQAKQFAADARAHASELRKKAGGA
jgi:hypothetical protein